MRSGEKKTRRTAATKGEPSPYARGRSKTRTRPSITNAVHHAQAAVGHRLLKLREQRGLSQQVAAELAGLHEKYLSRLERGLANPTLSTLVGLALAYRASLATIVEREGQHEAVATSGDVRRAYKRSFAGG